MQIQRVGQGFSVIDNTLEFSLRFGAMVKGIVGSGFRITELYCIVSIHCEAVVYIINIALILVIKMTNST